MSRLRWLCREGERVLVAVPYMGGGALGYARVARELIAPWSMVSVDPPGHGGDRQRCLERFDALLSFYWDSFASLRWEDAVLYGHSLGGLVAYALARALAQAGRHVPVILSGAPAPDGVDALRSALSGAGYGGLRSRLIGTSLVPPAGGSPPFDDLDRCLRADHRVLESYCPQAPERATRLRVFGALEDAVVPPREIEAWRAFGSDVEIEYFHGDHMFIHESSRLFARRLVRAAASLLEAGPAADRLGAATPGCAPRGRPAAHDVGNEGARRSFGDGR